MFVSIMQRGSKRRMLVPPVNILFLAGWEDISLIRGAHIMSRTPVSLMKRELLRQKRVTQFYVDGKSLSCETNLTVIITLALVIISLHPMLRSWQLRSSPPKNHSEKQWHGVCSVPMRAAVLELLCLTSIKIGVTMTCEDLSLMELSGLPELKSRQTA